MSKIFAFILLIGPLIFIHELGHLLAAKLVDVKVGRFSLGFGPPLLRRRVGETEYCLAPIPLGGYVTLLGQNPYEEIAEADRDRALSSKPLWARYFVLAAGPAANLLLPLLLYFFFFLTHAVQPPPVIGTVLDGSAAALAGLEPGDRIVEIDGDDVRSWKEMQSKVATSPDVELRLEIEKQGKRVERFVTPRRSFFENALGVPEPRGLLGVYAHFYAPQIGIVDPESPAYAGGLRTGDVITSIDGEPVRTIEDLEALIADPPDSLVRLTYLRPKATQFQLGTLLWFESNHAQLLPRPESRTRPGLGDAATAAASPTGLLPANTFVRAVAHDSPAARAGLLPGDRVLEVGGQAVTRWESVANILDRLKDEPVTLLVQSVGDEPRELTLQQEIRTRKDIYKTEYTYLYFGAEPYGISQPPQLEPIRGRFTYATRAAWDESVYMLEMMWTALRQMVTLQRGVDELSSVVGIFAFAGTAAEQGPTEFLMLMALISLNLGFVNLLPIPILDGGHLLFFTIEAVRRKPLGQRAREIASAVGLVIVLLLMLIALRNDVIRFWMD
ncbi:RIP metalloprotease RseP [Pseudenhygromyxa sp. WMMC2535]|uniref:RIP metalloprotease RseP n=1 Tax=Pseudenhygromyxa sp. WMMC2535 TaxID=2712867 RepID=UPI001557DF4F|nr:RIP metalloprotease RseP [Pseudenhygromyxa sp. WMMC2535]NVB42559.1 RIP metalloprotease RseP [Pseudenhygromyxa sp. WMMC2535]